MDMSELVKKSLFSYGQASGAPVPLLNGATGLLKLVKRFHREVFLFEPKI